MVNDGPYLVRAGSVCDIVHTPALSVTWIKGTRKPASEQPFYHKSTSNKLYGGRWSQVADYLVICEPGPGESPGQELRGGCLRLTQAAVAAGLLLQPQVLCGAVEGGHRPHALPTPGRRVPTWTRRGQCERSPSGWDDEDALQRQRTPQTLLHPGWLSPLWPGCTSRRVEL